MPSQGNDETEVSTEKPRFKLPEHLVGTVFTGSVVDTPKPPKRISVSLEGVTGSRVDARNYRGNGHWQFDGPLGGPGYIGFIYVIRDVANEKLYLGKKQFRGLGRENKGQDSNWPWYISSSKELSASVKIHGKQKFEFVAIEQYKSKGMLSYAETWSLMYCETPFRRDKWYNLLVNKVSWVVKEPISDKHKIRLNMMLKAVEA